MGWQDRDYSREPAAVQGIRFRGRSFVFWLILINIVVFILDPILARAVGTFMFVAQDGEPLLQLKPLAAWGHFSASTAISGLQIWRFITFQFLHGGIYHLLFNMLALFFFGPMIESYLGSRRFLAFYLLCGVSGAVMYLLLLVMGVVVGANWIPLIGASAGIFGVLIAGARIAPNTTVMLLFPPIPMRLKTLAWIMVGIGAYTVLFGGNNAGGEAGHLGGAVLGFWLIRQPHLLNFAARRAKRGFSPRGRRRRPTVTDAEVDRILEKVRSEGLASLSENEKRTLQRATDEQRRAG